MTNTIRDISVGDYVYPKKERLGRELRVTGVEPDKNQITYEDSNNNEGEIVLQEFRLKKNIT